MRERRPSRRALLRYAGVGAAASVAGCLFDSSDEESQNGEENGMDNGNEEPNYSEQFELAGDGTAGFRNWLVPDNPLDLGVEVTSVCGYRDFETGVEQGVSRTETYRRELANGYGTVPDALEGELLVGAPEGTGRRQIHLGSFEDGAVVETFAGSEDFTQVEEYREYTIFESGPGNRVAIGPDAILSVSTYEQYIDASYGDAERLVDVDEDARLLFDILPRGVQIGVSRHGNLDDLSINGSSYHTLNDSGNPERTTRAFVFGEESDATVERAREIISIGETGYEEILTEEQHGRLVMIEYIVEWSG